MFCFRFLVGQMVGQKVPPAHSVLILSTMTLLSARVKQWRMCRRIPT
jgi:hypothetical protein